MRLVRSFGGVALAIGVGALALTALAKPRFDWRNELPNDYRLVDFTPPKSDLQLAWDHDSDNRPCWTFRVDGTLDQVEREIKQRLGSGWFRTQTHVDDSSAYLCLFAADSPQPSVEINAYGEKQAPHRFALWAARRLPLNKIGLAKDPESQLCIYISGRSRHLRPFRMLRRHP